MVNLRDTKISLPLTYIHHPDSLTATYSLMVRTEVRVIWFSMTTLSITVHTRHHTVHILDKLISIKRIQTRCDGETCREC